MELELSLPLSPYACWRRSTCTMLWRIPCDFARVPRSAKQLECPAMRGGMTRLESVEPPLAHGHVVLETQ